MRCKSYTFLISMSCI